MSLEFTKAKRKFEEALLKSCKFNIAEEKKQSKLREKIVLEVSNLQATKNKINKGIEDTQKYLVSLKADIDKNEKFIAITQSPLEKLCILQTGLRVYQVLKQSD